MTTLVFEYSFLKLATFQLGVAQDAVFKQGNVAPSSLPLWLHVSSSPEYRAAHPIVYHVPLSKSNFGKFHFLG
jgi:hypothetical protein